MKFSHGNKWDAGVFPDKYPERGIAIALALTGAIIQLLLLWFLFHD